MPEHSDLDGRIARGQEARLSRLREAIRRGIADAEAGRVENGDAFLDRLEAKYRDISD